MSFDRFSIQKFKIKAFLIFMSRNFLFQDCLQLQFVFSMNTAKLKSVLLQCGVSMKYP